MSDLKTWELAHYASGELLEVRVFRATDADAHKWAALEGAGQDWKLQEIYPYEVDAKLVADLKHLIDAEATMRTQAKDLSERAEMVRKDIAMLRKRGYR